MRYDECNGEDSRLREKTHTGADVEGSPDPLLLFNKPPTNEPPKKKLEMCSSICFSSRHVPLLLAVSTIVFLFIVIVGLAVSFHTGAPEPCSSCKPCGYSAPCEEDWIWYRGKCYYFSETYDEWNNSQNFCASHNASLSLIDSQEELDFLIRHKDIADHWIGLYRDAEGIMWVWANGSKFKNTFRIEGRSPCVYLSDNHLVSTSCHRDKKWICNKLEPNVHRNVFRRRQ